MVAGLHNSIRCIAVLVGVSLCLLGDAATAQPSGTLLQRTATASGAGTLTVEFDVVGLVEAGTQTELTIEIGPEGNNGPVDPVPALPLPATAAFTINTSSSASSPLTFPPAGGTNQNFAGKTVSLIRLDPNNSPALYRLIVMHRTEIPEGTREKWKVIVSGLPQARTRAMGAIKQGVFSGMMPVGACQTLLGQSGTALQQLVTFRGGANPAIGIDIAGPRDALTQTTLLLEFGPEGNAQLNPVPDPALPDTARMKISTSGGSVSFPFANSDENFANKELHLVRFAPGLYLLLIRHLAGIPERTTEQWKVELTGIPTTSLRAIGSVEQGTIASLTPVLPCQDPPRISVSPSLIMGGETRDIVVSTASEDFDLSGVSDGQLRFDPPNIITRATITNRSPRSLTVSVTTADFAQMQEVKLAVSANNVTSQPATFDVVPRPGISVTPSFVIADGQATLNITTSSIIFDLSNGRVEISPPNIATGISVTSANPSALSATVTLAAVDQPQTLSLTVVANNVRSRPATFEVRPRPRITLSPTSGPGTGSATVAPGRARTFNVTSSEGFDLRAAGELKFTRAGALDSAFSGFALGDRTERNARLVFDLASDVPAGDRELTITANGAIASARFKVVTIAVAQAAVAPGRSRVLTVNSSEGFDLRAVVDQDVRFTRADTEDSGISNLVFSNRTERSLTLSFDVASDAPIGDRALSIRVGDVEALTRFKVATIGVSQPVVAPGRLRELTIIASEGFDLRTASAVKFTRDGRPDTDFSSAAFRNQSERSLTLSFDVSDGASAGDRELTVTANNVDLVARFRLVTISAAAPGLVAVPNFTDAVVLRIVSSEGFDLSNVGQAAVDPGSGISDVTVRNAMARDLTLSLTVVSDAQPGDRELIITANHVRASAKFKLIRLQPDPEEMEIDDIKDVKITASEGFSFMGVTINQVSVTGAGVFLQQVKDATERNVVVRLSTVHNAVGPAIVTIRANGISASTRVGVNGPPPPVCRIPGETCCDAQCTVCASPSFPEECRHHR
ncbi:hypothetical protein V5279_18950 [Bradyrhizobium sp. 26S5]|uniref:hypothetical protein n=1 Tax=Bradyrhizobium sp. 26S5 TaxID=3139729 RepID=UPI0030CAE700